MMAIRFRFRKTNLSFFSILDVFLPHDKIMNMFSLIFDIQNEPGFSKRDVSDPGEASDIKRFKNRIDADTVTIFKGVTPVNGFSVDQN